MESQAFAPSIAMGGVKNSIAFPYSINIANPASYAFLQLPTLDVGFAAHFLKLSYSDSTKKGNNAIFKNMVFAFPISKRWWNTSFGIVPYSKVGYSLSSTDTVQNFGKINYSYTGKGGIHRVFIGNSLGILKDSVQQFSIGTNISYLFGTIEKTKRVIPDAALLAFNEMAQNSTTVGDFHFDAGIIYSRKISNKWNFSVGGIYEFAKNMKAEKNTFAATYTGSDFNERIKDTIINRTLKNTIFLPQKIGGGLSVFYNNRWLFSFDYSMRDWTKFNNFGEENSLAKQEEISFGVQYNYNAKERENFFKMLSYRGGFRYNKTPLIIKNQQLKEFGITFGTGIPAGEKSKGTFNLAVENGIRGENKNGLAAEKFTNVIFGFSFTPTFYDKWFAKPKID